ncbi:MAG: MiaB/RimO family radical SAM methylthiotransferase [Anaerolineales bacterium]|nr:MiaB/RimO family radical SAM methylthiotransferase [Anaerolineales bacterium]MDW8226638.1 MiaB/RimO family radical SAM methylthiotransferase [Anaerolineales bacterium]
MKVYLDMVGCRLNQAEIERLGREFRATGHQIVAGAGEADLTIINTCAVTAEAAADSRSKIRQAARLGAKRIIATGCWATLEPEAALRLPAVERVVPNADKEHLTSTVLGLPPEAFDLEPLARQPLPGLRARTRAFIKVQDGCNNACTFCITTIARGASRSRPVADIIQDIRAALEGGTQEVVLTGVHLGAWGEDFSPPQHLADLVAALLTALPIPRLRLSSLEPWNLNERFFELWQDTRLCRHLHLPLQSGSPSVLRRMARKTTPEQFLALVEAARRMIPEVAITTDIIVGFPGESEREFAETLQFIRALELAGGHVFTYSARPGTAAARMRGRVHGEIARQRSAMLRQTLAESSARYRRRFLGRTMEVLWESASRLDERGWLLEGLTDNYLRITAYAPWPRWNRIDPVFLERETEDGLHGQIVPEVLRVPGEQDSEIPSLQKQAVPPS